MRTPSRLFAAMHAAGLFNARSPALVAPEIIRPGIETNITPPPVLLVSDTHNPCSFDTVPPLTNNDRWALEQARLKRERKAKKKLKV